MDRLSVPDIVTIIAISMSVFGALLATRRQANVQIVEDNEELMARVRILESANHALINEFTKANAECQAKIRKLEMDYENVRDTYEELVQETSALKNKYNALQAENDALSKALGRIDGRKLYE